MQNILKILCTNTYTVTDLHRRVGLLQSCLEHVLYTEQEGTTADIAALAIAHAKEIGAHEDADALAQWDRKIWESFNQQNLPTQLQILKEAIEQLPSLTLYVPVQFDAEAEALLGVWCREHINQNLVLELLVDPKVTGGCAVIAGDQYHDLSLANGVEAHKGVVTELLNSYV